MAFRAADLRVMLWWCAGVSSLFGANCQREASLLREVKSHHADSCHKTSGGKNSQLATNKACVHATKTVVGVCCECACCAGGRADRHMRTWENGCSRLLALHLWSCMLCLR